MLPEEKEEQGDANSDDVADTSDSSGMYWW